MIIQDLTQAEALELLAIRKKAGEPAPEKGTHIGGGRHVPMPESWDGTGKVPAGWSGLSGVTLNVEKNSYAVEVIDLATAMKSKLSATEIKKIEDAISAESAKLKEAVPEEPEEPKEADLELPKGGK